MTSRAPAYCVFCEIIAGNEDAEIWHEDDDFIVFVNHLRWLKIQLLIVPKKHKTQEQFWKEDMQRAAALAVELGKEHAPGGFRVLSNFGEDGMQSQPHAHLHLLGGRPLGMYVEPAYRRPFWS